MTVPPLTPTRKPKPPGTGIIAVVLLVVLCVFDLVVVGWCAFVRAYDAGLTHSANDGGYALNASYIILGASAIVLVAALLSRCFNLWGWICFALVGLGPAAFLGIPDYLELSHQQAADTASLRVLDAPLDLGDASIPAGATVQNRGDVTIVTLKPGQTFAGLPIVGTFSATAGGLQAPVTIASDTKVGGALCLGGEGHKVLLNGYAPSEVTCDIGQPTTFGIPCVVGGETTFEKDGAGLSLKCKIAKPYESFGIEWPAETIVSKGPVNDAYTIGSASPLIAVSGKMLPEGTTLQLGAASDQINISFQDAGMAIGTCAPASILVQVDRHPGPHSRSIKCESWGTEVGMGNMTIDGHEFSWPKT